MGEEREAREEMQERERGARSESRQVMKDREGREVLG